MTSVSTWRADCPDVFASADPAPRALSFDLDETLWETWPTIERAERRLHDWLAARYPVIAERYQPAELRAFGAEAQRQRPELGANLSLRRQEGLRLAAAAAGYDPVTFDAEAAFAVFQAGRNDVIFFPDAVAALERLARRYPLIALSNGNADVERVGLGHLFTFALNPEHVPHPKPDPAMFAAAQIRLGIDDPRQIVHIGDDPHTDVLGAAQLGWRTVWVNRAGVDWEHGHRPDAEVRDLDELDALLR